MKQKPKNITEKKVNYTKSSQMKRIKKGNREYISKGKRKVEKSRGQS